MMMIVMIRALIFSSLPNSSGIVHLLKRLRRTAGAAEWMGWLQGLHFLVGKHNVAMTAKSALIDKRFLVVGAS